MGTIDLWTIGGILFLFIVILITYDIVTYFYITSLGTGGRAFPPAFFRLASEAWEYRNELGINPSKYLSARTLEVFSPVILAIQRAIEKYEQ